MKTVKILTIIVINFILLIVIGVLALRFFVKTDSLKAMITTQVSSLTGQKFAINGPVHFSVYPVLGVAFQNAVLSNPSNFDQSVSMVDIQEGDVGIRLLSLLEGKVEIEKVILVSPVIRIIQDKNNNWNFQAIGKGESVSTEKQPAVDQKVSAEKIEFLSSVPTMIPYVSIKKGEFDIQEMNGEQTKISGVNLSLTKGNMRSVELPFAASFQLNQKDSKGTVEIKGQLFIEKNTQLDIRLLEIDTNVLSGKKTIKTHTSTDIMIGPDTISTEVFGAVINGTTITGNLTIKNYLSGLTQLTASGKIAIDKVVSPQINISKVSGVIQGKGGVFQLSPLTANVFGGSFNGAVGIDATKKTFPLFIKASLSGVNVQSLLQGLSGYGGLSGTGNLSTDLTINTAGPGSMVQSLNGKIIFNIANGKFPGIDLAKLVQAGMPILLGNPAAIAVGVSSVFLTALKAGHTDFRSAKGSAFVQNGILTNKDFVLETSDMIAKGAGTINLVRQTIDYEVDASPKKMQKIFIPVDITGDLSSPNHRPDMGKILKEAGQKILFAAPEMIGKSVQSITKIFH